MVSLQATTDSIRVAVSSTSTCTPATATVLSGILLPKSSFSNPTISINSSNTGKPIAALKSKTAKAAAATTKPRTKKVVRANTQQHGEQLSAKERSILATEVINATLKALRDAIKEPAAPLRHRESTNDLAKASARNALRRSNSLPRSPQQPRSLNRVSSSPNTSTRLSRSSSSTSATSSQHRSTAECARVAFSCLRALQASKIPTVDLPPLQLENGMSVLIGRLISLGLDDLAIKELRILKRRLDPEDRQPESCVPLSKVNPATAAAALLDFGKGDFTGPKLGLVITTQLHILRLLVSSRKYKHVEAALPSLQPSFASSPTKLLLLAAKSSPKTEKPIRQLQSLSEILLSLSPSVATADDAIALNQKLNVSPEVAIQLQTLAFHNRVLWWKLAGHNADSGKELLDPFLRCLSAFGRRSQCGAIEKLPHIIERFSRASISYLVLFAQEASLIGEAFNWTHKVQALLDPNTDSEARLCAVTARLLGLTLRRPSRQSKDEELLLTLLEGLERPFKGDSSEIDDLLTEVSATRRAAITILSQRSPAPDIRDNLTDGMREMCESLVLMCPRLSLRYLGSPPDANSVARDLVRYQQRRHFITKTGMHAIDSALFLIKTFLGERRLTWELMDSKLQECLLLLERLELLTCDTPLDDNASPPSYYVKISSLYYSQYLSMHRDLENPKDGLQIKALRRSIDCIRTKSQHEKKAASLSMKLERMAEICKTAGRYDELFNTLMSLRDEMICNGALSAVAVVAASRPVRVAWMQDEDTSTLARTMQSLVKVQLKYLRSGSQASLFEGQWSDDERASMLEHYLEILSSHSSNSTPARISRTQVFRAMLSLYDRERYPLRRLRVFIRLLSFDIACREEVIEDLSEELHPSNVGDIRTEGTKDEGLRGYLVHLQTLATTLLELQQDHPKVEILKQGLSVWSSITGRCGDLQALEDQVEDIRGLLSHLQSIADYMQVKGFDAIRLATLRLIADINEFRSDCPDELIVSLTLLGAQWLHLGYSGKAGLALDRAQSYSHQNGVTSDTLLQLHLAYSEYLLVIGNCDKSEEHLLRAQAISFQEMEFETDSRLPTHLAEKTRENQLISNAYLICSMLALERGAPQAALTHAKQSVRLLRRAWTNTEEQLLRLHSPPASHSPLETDKLADEVSQLSMSTVKISTTRVNHQSVSGSSFWMLVMPLFQGLSYLSGLYAHHGMFQETLYYAEQAHTLVKEAGSEELTALASAYLGSIWLKAGTLDKGSEFLMAAKQLCASDDKSRGTALLSYHLGNMHGLLGDHDAEVAAYEEAEMTLKILTGTEFVNRVERLVDPDDAADERMASLTISKREAEGPRSMPSRSKAPAKRKNGTRVKPTVEIPSSIAEECSQLISLQATVLRQKARAFMSVRRCVDAHALLIEANGYSKTQMDVVDQGLAIAKQLLLQSMEQMIADPVYSVLQESTISFPSVVGLSPPRKLQVTKCGRDRTNSKSPNPDTFFEKLRHAQDRLTEVHSIALTVAPVAVIHTISGLLNSVAILLSAAGQVKGKQLAHPGFASCSIETARTLSLHRENKAIHADPLTKLKMDKCYWPTLGSSDTRRSSFGLPSDMSRFQKEYIDIIPKSWTAISIALSETRNELSITKLQAGQSPFVLRLPLGRNNSIDADEEVFGFEQGHSELMEILDLANESAHDARDMTGRQAKTAWWEERESLDARLRDLLENIEKVWLGGFTGIFSQHARRADPLARFQKSFHNILDKYLPSRQKTRKRGISPRITLDSRILDLFIGLGDAADEDCDLSEPLTDLLYFVVDVLQFHGELNAYAEIDFDSIVVETHDALRGYHEAIKVSNSSEETRHTILILDKALHAFPWESLPCMDGLAISRLPSLGCLRDRILDQQKDMPEDAPQGRHINRENGSYILNPGGDLKNTQLTFQKPLQSLSGWHSVIKREPTEDEIRCDLESKDLFLYFGHGSGAQYIRAREIRKLKKCAVTMLMGCSSGALTEAGEFEPYGPPINYMHAGCPALVATLWDVTDKDIDRFAKSTFEHWGLFDSQAQTGCKGRSRDKVETVQEDQKMSLVEAVAKAKGACNLRYLNAAAVCIYGIPVYFK